MTVVHTWIVYTLYLCNRKFQSGVRFYLCATIKSQKYCGSLLPTFYAFLFIVTTVRAVSCKFATYRFSIVRYGSYGANLHDRARTVEICTIENLYGANLHDKAHTVQICTIGLVRCKFAS